MHRTLIKFGGLVAVLGSLAPFASGCASDPASGGGDADEALGPDSTKDALSVEPEYAEGRLHSKITAPIAADLRAVLGATHGDVHRFMKVGDSITFSTDFLDCLDRTTLSGANAALEPTRAWFDGGSWSRRSKASTIGWHVNQPLAGSPAPLDTEIGAMKPALAVVMLGTNDLDVPARDAWYRKNLATLIDTLLARKIIPILSTVPWNNHPELNVAVPRINTIVRAVASGARVDAQGRLVANAAKKIPLMDFHLALDDLPNHGISSDRTHPNVSSHGACDFGEDGLKHGYNVRTKLGLEAIDRVKRFVIDAQPTVD